MKYRLAAVVALVAFGAFSGACGGGGGSTGAGGSSVAGQPSAAGTSTPFDANILSAMVLGPNDVPLPGIMGAFNPGADPSSLAFSTTYGGPPLEVVSTVGRFSDPTVRTANFDRLRRSVAKIVKGEENYNVAGADRAFVYVDTSSAISAGLAFKGEFFVLIEMLSQDKSRVADATDRATLDKYMNLVFGRLTTYLGDPTSLTAVPEAEKFGDNATASAIAAVPITQPTPPPATP